jgi:hypothetical protein
MFDIKEGEIGNTHTGTISLMKVEGKIFIAI